MAPTALEDDAARRKRSSREENPPRKEGRTRYGDVNAKEVSTRNRHSERERRHSRRPRENLPVEPSAGTGTLVDAVTERKVEREDGGARREDGGARREDSGSRRSSFDRHDGPHRPKSYIQHDDRGGRHGGRTNDRRMSDHGRWDDSKEKPIDKGTETEPVKDLPKKEDSTRQRDVKGKSNARVGDKDPIGVFTKKNEQNFVAADEKNVWKHDRFYELEAEPPAKRRPPFRETKELEQNATDEPEGEASKPPRPSRFGFNSSRKEEGRYYNLRRLERYGRPPFEAGDKDFNRSEEAYSQKNEYPRYGIQPRDRYSGGAGVRGRERFNGRYSGGNSYQSGDIQVDKWKHDMFEDANRSPTPKNEEDQIAKIEALLAL